MNRNARIGVFDSGMGGLEMLDVLHRLLPDEDIFYFADTLNNPYGEKSPQEIEHILEDIVEGMMLRRVKLLLIACNTASTVFAGLAVDHPLKRRLRDAGIDVIPMTISEAVSDLAILEPKSVWVAATRLTVASGVYGRMILDLLPGVELREIAAPEWVRVIEKPDADAERARAQMREAVEKLLGPGPFPDALVLGCTHFPRLSAIIREHVGAHCAVIDPAWGLAHFVRNYLDVRGLAAEADPQGRSHGSVVFTNGPAEAIRERLSDAGLSRRYDIRQVDIRSDFGGKVVDVVGYGQTGKSLLRHLADKGAAHLRVRDRDERSAARVAADFPDLKIEPIVGEHYLEGAERADVLFRSPGVPADLPQFKAARRLGVPVMSDIELFLRDAPGRKVAISGTSGKTTTTILTRRLFASTIGDNARLVGNVGRPVLDEMATLNDESVCAVELSSFQLEELSALPVQAAILLNITPDHLDRHGDMAGYIRAKGRLFSLLPPQAFAIYNIDSEEIVNELLPKGCRARMIPFSTRRVLADGAFMRGPDIVFRHKDAGELILESAVTGRLFVGHHNFENLLAAGMAAFAMGVEPAHIERELRGFAGVSYRIELFHRMRGVDYFDDSKGTNPDATLKALAAMKQAVRLVAGGMNKGYTFDSIASACIGRVKKLYLFGEIAEPFIDALAGLEIPIPFERFSDLESAAQAAARQAKRQEAVLFSPASASPPGEKYYQRGDRFKAAVRELGADERQQAGVYLPDPLAGK